MSENEKSKKKRRSTKEYEAEAIRKVREKIPVDEIEKCAKYGMPTKEIADLLGEDEYYISCAFRDELIKARAVLKQSLRGWQLQAAAKGNTSMLIWLGKQLLGQSEVIEEIVKDEFKKIDAPRLQKLIEEAQARVERAHAGSTTRTLTIGSTGELVFETGPAPLALGPYQEPKSVSGVRETIRENDDDSLSCHGADDQTSGSSG